MSWFSRKVTAREGHQPINPGGLPAASRRRQNSPRSNTACRMPLVVTSKAVALPRASLIQFTMRCL